MLNLIQPLARLDQHLPMIQTGAFWISRYPITRLHHTQFIKATHYRPIPTFAGYDAPGRGWTGWDGVIWIAGCGNGADGFWGRGMGYRSDRYDSQHD